MCFFTFSLFFPGLGVSSGNFSLQQQLLAKSGIVSYTCKQRKHPLQLSGVI